MPYLPETQGSCLLLRAFTGQDNMVVQNKDSSTKFKGYLHQVLAVWPWTSHLTFLSLSFLISEIRTIIRGLLW